MNHFSRHLFSIIKKQIGFRFRIPVSGSDSGFRIPDSGFRIPCFRVALKIRFHMCQLRLNETVFMNLSAKREDGEVAGYPTVRSEIRTFSMDGALTRFDIPNLFQNRVPDRMIVGLVDSRAFNGAVTRDPFCFQKFQLTSIKQIVKGEEYPYETLQLVGNNSSKDLLG